MTDHLRDHLRELGAAFAGQNWQRRTPEQWTTAEHTEFDRVALASRDDPEAAAQIRAWLDWYRSAAPDTLAIVADGRLTIRVYPGLDLHEI